MKEKIYRAGIIPFILEDQPKMLFMLPTDEQYGGNSFQIAKGRRDVTDISDLDTALREGYEELGLLKENIKNITDLGTYLGRTRFYMAEVFSKDNFVKPHFETKETQWMTIEDFRAVGRAIHIKIVETAYKLITE